MTSKAVYMIGDVDIKNIEEYKDIRLENANSNIIMVEGIS